jgi:dockerin type I repeat protein
MKINYFTLALFGGLAVGTMVASTASAASKTLDFSAAVPGSILDSTGVGTGLTSRLSGTGTAIPTNDPNITLDTANSVLHITSPINTDLNGQVGVTMTEAVGMQLAPLGFNSTRDFSVTASFKNVPDNSILDSFDQIGVIVGSTSTTATRAMVINFDFFGNTNEFAAVNSVGGTDTGGNFNTNPTPAGNMSITIARSSGVWTYSLTGTSGSFIGTTTRMPTQPTFLNGLNDLTVGVVSLSTNATVFTADLDSFAVTVPVPGDANGDGFVNMQDFTDISNHLFQTVPSGTLGDANLDGVVNYADFRVWKNNFVGPGGGSAVPEPSTLVMGACALVFGMLGRRRFVS